MKPLLALILICTAAVACSKPSEAPAPKAGPAPVPPAAAASGPGTVAGTLPPAVGGFPSIVILEPQGGTTVPAQRELPAMDQIQQNFIPAVLMVRTGQPVEFRNSDEVLHNVRVREDA